MRRGRRWWAASLGILAVAGCGGSGSTTVTHTVPSPQPGTSASATTTSASAPTSTTTGSGAGGAAPAAPTGAFVPAGFTPQSVTFVSPSLGWVMGKATCSSPPCLSIVRTMDGGRTWRGVPAPRTNLGHGFQGGVTELRFVDTNDGFAFGPSLWVTHDGGAHWQQSPVPRGGQIVALAGNGGRVLAVVQLGADLNDEVVESPAGQLKWRTVLMLRGSVDEGDLALFGPVAWLAFGTGMYTTSDSVHWTLRHPCPEAYRFVAATSLTSATDGVVGCGGQGFTGHQLKRVYGSGDGARSFSLLGTPPVLGGLTEIAATSNFGVTVGASSAASWLYGSFDGGRRYATTLLANDGGNGWRDLGFTTSEQGVVVNSGDFPGPLWMTRDAGHHWTQVSFG